MTTEQVVRLVVGVAVLLAVALVGTAIVRAADPGGPVAGNNRRLKFERNWREKAF